MNVLGQRIKSLRINNNLNQKELAKKLNISNTTLSQYESAQRVPSDEIKIQIANIFNVSLDYLLGKSNIKNPYKEIPDKITTVDEAIQFLIEDSTIFGFNGFDVNKLSDEEKINFANELLEQFKLVSYKYKK